jgi:hypothetical protein
MAVALPMTAAAQSRVPQAGPRTQTQSTAFRTGFDRGLRLGEEDGRRNSRFDYAGKSEYRNADAGYNRNYGDRTRYQSEFRVGFEDGYREAYSRYQSSTGSYGSTGGYGGYNDGTYRPGTGGPPPWANGRGRGQGNGNGSWQRNDLAFQNGFTDGYDEGLKDVRDRDRFDPSDEGRYRNADHGYKSSYGSRDAYRARYRDAFREGYQTGFDDARRNATTGYGSRDPQYDSRDPRYDPRVDSRTGQTRPWWWPW